MKKWMVLMFFGIFGLAASAQSAHQFLRQGDKSYDTEAYTQAEENYRKSLEKKNSVQGNYNLGNAIYKQERYEEAVSRYEAAARVADDDLAKALAYHNLGNAYFKQQNYEKSIDAYKSSLRLNPKDIETKKNLALAQRQLQIQQQQQKQNQQDKQQQQEQQQDQQQQPEQQQQQNQQDQSSGQEQPQDLSKEEARKLLEIMEQEEQKVQQKLRKAQTKPNRSTKDW